jgi:hypothetical protein
MQVEVSSRRVVPAFVHRAVMSPAAQFAVGEVGRVTP